MTGIVGGLGECIEWRVGECIEWRVGENAHYVDGAVHPLDAPWELLAYPHLSHRTSSA
ncbi:hypothetical protein [Halomarina ordinaria]|uniref:Uncharacterized protein n=1 Tax=Halomarina ordinaria TaxID=3033939 RepID=A0ABD5U8E7_9EURY|nr:hypothetical protein [Halomarina sp. PSRA2]